MSDKERNIAPEKLVLLITVVQKGKGTFFADFIKTFDSNLQVSIVGTGTAESNLAEFLGLKENKRSIVFSILREENEDLKVFRLALSENVSKIVKLAMSLLGIEVPERM